MKKIPKITNRRSMPLQIGAEITKRRKNHKKAHNKVLGIRQNVTALNFKI